MNLAQAKLSNRAQIGDDLKCVSDLMRDFSIEVTPGSAKKVDEFGEQLGQRTRVYVTSLPGSDFATVIETCKRLANEGMIPVPHFVARSMASKAVLEDRLAAVTSESRRHPSACNCGC